MNKVDICNLALSFIGNRTITDIDNPITTEEKICSIWYETTVKQCLIESSPNFARTRAIIPLSNNNNPFGFQYSYQLPNNCLKVLGIGETYQIDNDYCIEDNYIFTDEISNNSLPIRFIKYVDDVNKWSEPFKRYTAISLAVNICYQINKDLNLLQFLEQNKAQALLDCNTFNNQESKLTIIYNPRYESSRFGQPYKRIQK